MKHIFAKLILGLLMVTAMFTSCNESQEGILYDNQGKDGVSFLSSLYSTEIIPEMNGVVKVPICRIDKTANGTIANIQIVGENSSFSLASSSVSFKEGEAEGYAELQFKIDELEFGQSYLIKLEILSDNLSPAAKKICQITVNKKLTWRSIGMGTWTTSLFGGTFDAEFEEAIEAPGKLYRTVNLIETGFPIEIKIDKAKGTAAVNYQNTGYNNDGSILYYNASGTYQGGIVTFPKANANNPNNYYYTKTATGYSPAYNLSEEFQLPAGH